MKTRLMLAILLAACAMAADVAGKWRAEFQTPDGQTRTSIFTLQVQGDKLTGTVSSPRGEAPIQEGKVSGDEISFVVVREFGGNEVRIHYKGKVAGDELRLTVEFGDRSFEMTAKRIRE
ncbi:MAG: hypothetical protein RMI94_13780 [Bryobacterales bacterium]|nr:hypothetical protein [Bryobacterales bacterium]